MRGVIASEQYVVHGNKGGDHKNKSQKALHPFCHTSITTAVATRIVLQALT